MREIARFYDAEEAKVAAGFLRAQGFAIIIPEEHHLGSSPHLSFAVGGYRLLASREEAHMATMALAEKQTKPKHDACEACGGTDIRRQRHRWLPLAVFLWLASTPFAPAKSTLRCKTCGHEWKDKDDES